MSERVINFGVIGCGLMGREFASAAARWNHLVGLDVRPRIVGACDTSPAALGAFCSANAGVRGFANHHDLLAQKDIEALYIAVPHNLHKEVYLAAIAMGKHFLGEKPFGIDREANRRIMGALRQRRRAGGAVARRSFRFSPGVQKIVALARSGQMGRILEVRCGLLHSSDMDPLKPMNWKRMVEFNGEYGCMGDLGMHAVHVPFRLGYRPRDVRAMLTKVVKARPDGKGGTAPCETWDNALLACTVGSTHDDEFPMLLEMKRMAPGHMNTWFLEIYGTALSARFSTRHPRTLELLPYERGRAQAWLVQDLGYESAYPAITGGIFEFGFSDAIQQMWAAYCDELAHGAAGMKQPFTCATPDETEQSHALFDAALKSARDGAVVRVG